MRIYFFLLPNWEHKPRSRAKLPCVCSRDVLCRLKLKSALLPSGSVGQKLVTVVKKSHWYKGEALVAVESPGYWGCQECWLPAVLSGSTPKERPCELWRVVHKAEAIEVRIMAATMCLDARLGATGFDACSVWFCFDSDFFFLFSSSLF